MLAFLPAPGGRAKRLLWALMGGYGLFLHAALVHQHHLWAETSTTTTGASSDTSNTGGITALMSRALLRRETAGQPPGVAAPPRPQYEAQAFFPPLPAAKDDEARIPARRRPENTTEAEAAAGAAAMATEQPPPPPITSPASEFWRAEEARIRAGPGYAAKVDAGSARPLRSVGEMGRAQACFRKGEGYAYLMHMRKAGGTTLRQYMNNFIMEREEATGKRPRVYVTEGTTFNVSCLRDQGELVVVTALRHPISRILSAYWYEGREWAKVPPLHPSTDDNIKTALYNPDEIKSHLPLSFKEWVRRTRVDDYARWHQMSKRTVWSSVDNYFIRTLTNRYRPNPVAAITEREFQLAKRILSSFDLVLITEHMKWPNQTAYARGVLWGEEGLVGGALEEATAEARGRRGLGGRGGQQMVEKMGVHNRVQVAKDDSEIDAETLRGLWDSNHWDLLLYHYAVNLVRERVAAFEKGDVVGGVGEGDGGGQCKQPVNDPEYRRDKPKEGEDPGKPHRDSYLFSAPFCETNDYGIEALDETLGFPW